MATVRPRNNNNNNTATHAPGATPIPSLLALTACRALCSTAAHGPCALTACFLSIIAPPIRFATWTPKSRALDRSESLLYEFTTLQADMPRTRRTVLTVSMTTPRGTAAQHMHLHLISVRSGPRRQPSNSQFHMPHFRLHNEQTNPPRPETASPLHRCQAAQFC